MNKKLVARELLKIAKELVASKIYHTVKFQQKVGKQIFQGHLIHKVQKTGIRSPDDVWWNYSIGYVNQYDTYRQQMHGGVWSMDVYKVQKQLKEQFQKFVKDQKSKVSVDKEDKKTFYLGRFLSQTMEISVKCDIKDGITQSVIPEVSSPPCPTTSFIRNDRQLDVYIKEIKTAISENEKYIQGLKKLVGYLEKIQM